MEHRGGVGGAYGGVGWSVGRIGVEYREGGAYGQRGVLGGGGSRGKLRRGAKDYMPIYECPY